MPAAAAGKILAPSQLREEGELHPAVQEKEWLVGGGNKWKGEGRVPPEEAWGGDEGIWDADSGHGATRGNA